MLWAERGRTGREGGWLVLQGGHAVSILVERVENPTDNRSASLLCCRVADADSSETISPRWPRRTSPHTPLRAPGPAATSTELTGPAAEGGTGRRNKT